MKCSTLSSSRGPQQTKPASGLKSLKQTIGLIFKDKNPGTTQIWICYWEESNERAISISTDHWLKLFNQSFSKVVKALKVIISFFKILRMMR